MSLLGSKDSNDLPVPQVKALSDRGYAENDIKDILRKKGYSENEISLTLQKALIAKVNPQRSGIIPLDPAPQSQPQLPSAPSSLQQLPSAPESPMHQELQEHFDDSHVLFGSIGAKQEDLSFEKSGSLPPALTHEEQPHHQDGYEIDLAPIVEAIVEEKWNDIGPILADVQERLDALEHSTKGGKSDDVAQVEYLVKQTQERVERLEQSLDDVSIKVNSIEKAFKQFIPSLTGNIKALSEAVRHIRVGETDNPQ